jgi:hypothetical protein
MPTPERKPKMSTIPERVAIALSEEIGVPVESITVTRNGAWWDAECGGVSVAARRRGAIIEAITEYGPNVLRFPDSTQVEALRASIAEARRLARSCDRQIAARRTARA